MKNKRREKLLIVVLSAALAGMVLFTFARSSYFDKPNPAPAIWAGQRTRNIPQRNIEMQLRGYFVR